jgi:hypothetical protein
LTGFSRGPNVWPGGGVLGRDVKFISDLIDKLKADYRYRESVKGSHRDKASRQHRLGDEPVAPMGGNREVG